jgi:hypothetical protein
MYKRKVFFFVDFHHTHGFPQFTYVLQVLAGCFHNNSILGHGGDVDRVNDPDLAVLTRLKASVGSALSSSNGATKRGIGGSQGDGRVEVLLGSDSAGAVAVALRSGAVAVGNQYL